MSSDKTKGIEFLLNPDADMAWIYDSGNPDYNTPRAESLREARGRALRSCPEWMLDLARMNDDRRKRERTK